MQGTPTPHELNLQDIRRLANTYYKTFYFKFSLKNWNASGGLSLLFFLLFLWLFISFIFYHVTGNLIAAYTHLGFSYAFEISWLLCLSASLKKRRANEIHRQGLIPSPDSYDPKQKRKIQKAWIERNLRINSGELYNFCDTTSKISTLHKQLNIRADGIGSQGILDFFTVQKDRALALFIALVALFASLFGAGPSNFESFMSSYGDIKNYLIIVLSVCGSVSMLILTSMWFSNMLHLVFNGIREAFPNKNGCTEVTLSTFLRDCTEIAKL
jgi:hypothetical protein